VIPISLACRAPETLSAACEYTLLVSVVDAPAPNLPIPPQRAVNDSNKFSSSTALSVLPPTAPIEEKQLIAG
jgi:hypothetical protein